MKKFDEIYYFFTSDSYYYYLTDKSLSLYKKYDIDIEADDNDNILYILNQNYDNLQLPFFQPHLITLRELIHDGMEHLYKEWSYEDKNGLIWSGSSNAYGILPYTIAFLDMLKRALSDKELKLNLNFVCSIFYETFSEILECADWELIFGKKMITTRFYNALYCVYRQIIYFKPTSPKFDFIHYQGELDYCINLILDICIKQSTCNKIDVMKIFNSNNDKMQVLTDTNDILRFIGRTA